MKNSIKVILILVVAISLTNCLKENHLVTYPKSLPVFEQALVSESIITYGDSITVNATVSDNGTPLSTLEVGVVVNNEVVASESVRTKGNSSTINQKYLVPFVANRTDNAPIKVYLSSINVDGYHTDTILNTTIGKRPVISEVWFIPIVGKSVKLTLIDSDNYVYKATGLNFGTTITYRLATKVDKSNKIDWTGLVFGKQGDGVGLIDQDGEALTNVEPSLVGISEFTFDALKFTVKAGGKLLLPVTTLDINADLLPDVMASKNFKSGNVFFGQGLEVTFTGLTNLSNSLPPDYFEVTGANTAKFLGNDAIYKAYYYIDGNYLYVEPQPEVIYPDAMWICGTSFGRPSSPYETTASWNWNTPFDYAPCRLVSTGVYQVTIYVNNKDDLAGFGTLDFKFFFKRGWWDAAHEIDASTYTVSPPLFGLNAVGKVGNVNGMTSPFEGVYRITLDQNAKTITSVKTN